MASSHTSLSDLLSANANNAVREYIIKEGIANPTLDVTNGAGSGENFVGHVLKVVGTETAPSPNSASKKSKLEEKNVHVIVKVPPTNVKRRLQWDVAKHFQREIYAYGTVLPALEEFQKRRMTAQNIFNSYPSMLGSNKTLEDEYVLLPDLRELGYSTKERTQPFDFDTCSVLMQQLAKFHAVSFALKDQDKAEYEKLKSDITEIAFTAEGNVAFENIVEKTTNITLSHLTKPEDQALAEKVKKFQKNFKQNMLESCTTQNDDIILHGDVTITNIMFNKNKPEDLKLLDWQSMRVGSPAIDISFILFLCTNSEIRAQYQELLRIYHNTLCERITELGSDGKTLFPFDKLLSNMKEYGKFSFGMALLTLHATCCPSDKLHILNIQNILDRNSLADENCGASLEILVQQPNYNVRLEEVVRDMDKFEYLDNITTK